MDQDGRNLTVGGSARQSAAWPPGAGAPGGSLPDARDDAYHPDMDRRTEPFAGQAKRRGPLFRAVLYPHRSLSPRGFRLLMGGTAALSLGLGSLFFIQGAWPIVGFLGLDVLLLYIALKASYRSGRMYETVELTEAELTVERVEPKGDRRSWRFQPAWLRIDMDDPPRHESQLTLSASGQDLVVGSFLTPEERLDLARTLRRELDHVRRPPHLGTV